MVGLPTRLKVADLVFPTLKMDAALRPWFMLGALGPALGDFVPNEPNPVAGAPGRTGYYRTWQQAFQIAFGNPNILVPVVVNNVTQQIGLPGVVKTLGTLQQVLSQEAKYAADHDFNGMMALKGSLNDFQSAMADLTAIINHFSDPNTLSFIGSIIGGPGSKPKIDSTSNLWPPQAWTGREWLSWKGTGDFTAHLVARSQTWNNGEPEPRFVAYAKGWCVAYATLVSGSGFVDSVIGSCYRTHWWRSRWVANFIDSWVWGFYGAGAVQLNDRDYLDGNFDYDSWPSLCAAGLDTWIDPQALGLDPSLDAETIATQVAQDTNPDTPIPLPQALPSDFSTFWMTVWNEVYNEAGNDPAPLFTAERLNAGYVMTWLVLWFQTSGDVIGCNPQPPAQPPSACTAAENTAAQQWANPTQTNPPSTPVVQTPEHDPNIGEVVCGVCLALLGVASAIFGGFLIGGGLLAAGITLGVDGEEQLNWDELECNTYWLSWYMWYGLDALHKLTVLGGFQYPYAADLAISGPTTIAWGGEQLSYMSGKTTCQSQVLQNMLVPWDGTLLTFTSGGDPTASWTNYPTGALEMPATTPVWELDGLWPSAFIDDQENRNPAVAPILTSPPSYDSGVEGSFGPAVSNAGQVIAAATGENDPGQPLPAALPNWNLDGDRALGWLTWQLTQPYNPANVQTEQEQ